MGVHMTKSQTDKPEAGSAPGEWLQQSAGLFMRADDTDAGRLVRLADVALWLIDQKGLPRIPAANHLADRLEAAQPVPALFRARAGDYAQPVEGDAARFGYHTAESWAARDVGTRRTRYVVSRNIGASDDWMGLDFRRRELLGALVPIAQQSSAPSKPPEFVEPGVPALLRLLRQRWTFQRWGWRTDAEIFIAPQLPGFAVAVRVADAARIWGFGNESEKPASALTFDQVAPLRKKSKRAPWNPDHWRIVCDEIQDRGGAGAPGVVSGVADALGMTARGLNDLLKKRHQSERPADSKIVALASKNDPFQRAAGSSRSA